jgi:hypothetical protein
MGLSEGNLRLTGPTRRDWVSMSAPRNLPEASRSEL